MKFAAMLGVTATIPAAAATPHVDVVVDNSIIHKGYHNPPVPPENGLTFSFDFNDYWVDIVSDDGNFTFQESHNYDFIRDRGCLIGAVPRGVEVEFDLDCYIKSVSDDNFINETKNSREFNFKVVRPNGFSYYFENCTWHTMSYDMAAGAFELSGTARQ